MASDSSWGTIESDPGVFSELIERIGVRDAELQELYTLDDAVLKAIAPVYGLVFLFKWNASLASKKAAVEDAPEIYFAQQVISNACATQALLAILMNQSDDTLDIGEQLKNLRDFTADFPPDMKGITIGNADGIRVAHNSFSAPEAHLSEDKGRQATEDDDVYHFVSYIYKAGAIWELDGLQQGPIKHRECKESEWLDQVTSVVNERIALYSQQEIRFNLMAVVKDYRREYSAQLQQIESDLEKGPNEELASQRVHFVDALEHAQARREKWRLENERRKHNYIPFIFNVFQILAERDELKPLLEQARAAAAAKGTAEGAKAEDAKPA